MTNKLNASLRIMVFLSNADPKSWSLKGGAIRVEPVILLIILILLVVWFGLYVYDKFLKNRQKRIKNNECKNKQKSNKILSKMFWC